MLITKLIRYSVATCMFFAGYIIYKSIWGALFMMSLYCCSYILGAASLKYEIDNEDK